MHVELELFSSLFFFINVFLMIWCSTDIIMADLMLDSASGYFYNQINGPHYDSKSDSFSDSIAMY